MRLDIGLDVDGVLYPLSSQLARWTERRKGLPVGVLDDHPLTWHWYRDQWGMGDEEFLAHLSSGVQAGVMFAQGDPTEGSVAAVRRLHAAGHRLHYITNREMPGVSADHAWQVTHRWLHEHGFIVDSLTVSADKSVVRTDVYLDDRVENVEALHLAGHRMPVLWDRPYNREAVRRLRVRDWHQFESLVASEATWADRVAA